MPTYLVSYDLYAPKQDYQSLIERIKKFPSHCKVADSTWLIGTSFSSSEKVFDKLIRFLDEDDILFVIETTDDFYMSNADTKIKIVERIMDKYH